MGRRSGKCYRCGQWVEFSACLSNLWPFSTCSCCLLVRLAAPLSWIPWAVGRMDTQYALACSRLFPWLILLQPTFGRCFVPQFATAFATRSPQPMQRNISKFFKNIVILLISCHTYKSNYHIILIFCWFHFHFSLTHHWTYTTENILQEYLLLYYCIYFTILNSQKNIFKQISQCHRCIFGVS